jgi:hypothetical protein
MGATPATAAVTAAATAVIMEATDTAVDIRHRGFRFPWDTETTMDIHRRIMETPFTILVTVGIQATVATMATVATLVTVGKAHGTTQAIWTTTRLRWFLTAVTSIMSPAITMCIARVTGIVTAINFYRGTRLSACCRQADFCCRLRQLAW